MATSTYSQDTDLAKYFADVEPLRAWFDQAAASETLSKRLLVIWGVGGIGKSSLPTYLKTYADTAIEAMLKVQSPYAPTTSPTITFL